MTVMTLRQQSQSLFYVTALATLLFIAARIQSCNSQQVQCDRMNTAATCNDRDNFYRSYGSCVDPGFKVVDSLRAQQKFILSDQIGVTDKFVPSLPPGSTEGSLDPIPTLKSVIEVIRMKEQYEALNAMTQDPQLALAQLLFGKVVEESCLWLNESSDINIPDCTNIDLSLLEELYLRMDLYQTLRSTLNDMLTITRARIHDIYTCAWMNDRVLENCADRNRNYNHRDTLNVLCDPIIQSLPRRLWCPIPEATHLCTRT